MREYVAFAHDVRREDSYHDVLRDVYQMNDMEGLDAVSLLLQCEGDYHWVVRHRDLTEDDPPVCGFSERWDGETDIEAFAPDGHNPIETTVTSFVLNYAFDYMERAAGGFGTGTDAKDGLGYTRRVQG